MEYIMQLSPASYLFFLHPCILLSTLFSDTLVYFPFSTSDTKFHTQSKLEAKWWFFYLYFDIYKQRSRRRKVLDYILRNITLFTTRVHYTLSVIWGVLYLTFLLFSDNYLYYWHFHAVYGFLEILGISTDYFSIQLSPVDGCYECGVSRFSCPGMWYFIVL
jgi:hypothetical protein